MCTSICMYIYTYTYVKTHQHRNNNDNNSNNSNNNIDNNNNHGSSNTHNNVILKTRTGRRCRFVGPTLPLPYYSKPPLSGVLIDASRVELSR